MGIFTKGRSFRFLIVMLALAGSLLLEACGPSASIPRGGRARRSRHASTPASAGPTDPESTGMQRHEQRYSIAKIKTNAGRACGSNAQRGHIWNNFSSETYKNLPPVFFRTLIILYSNRLDRSF